MRDMRQAVCAAYLRMARAEISRAAKLVNEASARETVPFLLYNVRFVDFLVETKDERYFAPEELETAHGEAHGQRWLEM